MNSVRPVDFNDMEMMRQWRNSPDVAKYMYTDQHISCGAQEKWFRGMLVDKTKLYWIIELDNVPVGVANLYDIDFDNRKCMWAFYIADPNTRGQGLGNFAEHFLMNYAFEELCLNRLSCTVLTTNVPVILRHTTKFHFRKEAYFHQYIIKDGKAVDVVEVAMLRSEWDLVKDDIRKLKGVQQ